MLRAWSPLSQGRELKYFQGFVTDVDERDKGQGGHDGCNVAFCERVIHNITSFLSEILPQEEGSGKERKGNMNKARTSHENSPLGKDIAEKRRLLRNIYGGLMTKADLAHELGYKDADSAAKWAREVGVEPVLIRGRKRYETDMVAATIVRHRGMA